MAIRYPITLSTTEPNNNVGLLKIRQADEQTQTLVVQLTETSTPKSYEGLQVFFCAKLGQSLGLGIIEQKLDPAEMTNPKVGQLEYTFRNEDWQQIGRQVGYFSFRKMKDDGHEYVEQFTTRDFIFNVVKNVYSDGIKEIKKDGSTYIWTFEDLLRLLKEFIDSGRTDFESWFDEIKNQLSDDAAGNLLLLYQQMKSEVDDATVAEDGTVYPSLKDRLDKHNTKVEIEESSVREVFVPALEAFKSQINTGNFNLGINTDCHFEDTQNLSQYSTAALGLSHVQNILYCGDVLDAIVFAGDNVHGDAINLAAIKKQQQMFADLALTTDAGCDVFLTIGNHDDGSGRKRTTLLGDNLTYSDIICEEEFKKYYRTADNLFGESRDGNSLYCYKDYPDKGIRLIVLNSSDIPENIPETDSDKLKYLRFLTHSYSQTQLTWLSNVALKDVPEDYHVIAVQHTPLQFGWELAPAVYYNHDLILGVLKAFRDGTTYSGASTNVDFPAVVNVDFSSQGPRTFCGVFSGHLHNEKNYLVDGINNSTLLNSVADKESRVVDTVLEDAFSVLEIDKVARQVRIHGFGAAQDRSISY